MLLFYCRYIDLKKRFGYNHAELWSHWQHHGRAEGRHYRCDADWARVFIGKQGLSGSNQLLSAASGLCQSALLDRFGKVDKDLSNKIRQMQVAKHMAEENIVKFNRVKVGLESKLVCFNEREERKSQSARARARASVCVCVQAGNLASFYIRGTWAFANIKTSTKPQGSGC